MIDRRITNGLAWAGALLVVGIPTADLLSAQFMGAPAAPESVQVAVVERIAPVPAPVNQRPAAPVAKPATEVAATPVAKPVTRVAAVAPAKPVAAPKPAAQTADAVDAFLKSGRELPSYISDGNAPAAPAQAATTAPARTPITTVPAAEPAEIDPVEVASIPPQKVAPVPVALVRDPGAIVIPPGLTPAEPAAIVRPPVDVTAAELEDWESGPLADFLAERQAGTAYVDPRYDSDGFFLDQGPNRPRRDRVISRDEGPFVFFAD